METATRTNTPRWIPEPLLGKDGKPRIARVHDGDKHLLNPLTRFRFLPTKFLVALHGKHPGSTQERLNLLYRPPNRFVDRVDLRNEVYNPLYKDDIYELPERGLKLFGLAEDAERFGNRRHFAHSVMICTTIASLELGAPGMIWPEELPGVTHRIDVDIEYTNRDGEVLRKQYPYENDSRGVFGIRYEDGTKRYFQLEAELEGVVDRDTLEQSSFLRKFLSIQHIVAKKLYSHIWQLPQLLTLVACPTQHDIDMRKELIMRETKGKGCPHILFAVVPTIKDLSASVKPMPELYTGAWQRAGHPDFYLNQ